MYTPALWQVTCVCPSLYTAIQTAETRPGSYRKKTAWELQRKDQAITTGQVKRISTAALHRCSMQWSGS
jgi:hypothetical protein